MFLQTLSRCRWIGRRPDKKAYPILSSRSIVPLLVGGPSSSRKHLFSRSGVGWSIRVSDFGGSGTGPAPLFTAAFSGSPALKIEAFEARISGLSSVVGLRPRSSGMSPIFVDSEASDPCFLSPGECLANRAEHYVHRASNGRPANFHAVGHTTGSIEFVHTFVPRTLVMLADPLIPVAGSPRSFHG